MTYPDTNNLVKWEKASEKYCNTCGERMYIAKHLLVLHNSGGLFQSFEVLLC